MDEQIGAVAVFSVCLLFLFAIEEMVNELLQDEREKKNG